VREEGNRAKRGRAESQREREESEKRKIGK
jgi:hypothetical protein